MYTNLMKQPLEYETNIASFMEKVEANPPINFDDLVPYEFLECLDFEVNKYQRHQVPPMSNSDPVEEGKAFRPGCEYESILRQASGDPSLEQVQLDAQNQMELVKAESKEIVSGAIVKMPNTMLKPFDYSISLLLRPHPSLRVYLPLKEHVETDPEYHLYPYRRERIVPTDEIMIRNNRIVGQNFGMTTLIAG